MIHLNRVDFHSTFPYILAEFEQNIKIAVTDFEWCDETILYYSIGIEIEKKINFFHD